MQTFKTRNELIEHYWSVIVPMAREHGIQPWECVKVNDLLNYGGHPHFSHKPESYTFAIVILEGKPVFVGDKVWGRHIEDWLVVSECFDGSYYTESKCSWTPPTKKRMFVLNGSEHECPIKYAEDGTEVFGMPLLSPKDIYWFTSRKARDGVYASIKSLLDSARDKE